jgi:transcriptional regulator with XRE-family HTH domain
MAFSAHSAGAMLRHWRHERGLSQLRLALEADVSTRHISFLENGRANPSREMIVQLSSTLEIPLRERNRILEAAGFASAYRQTALDEAGMGHIAKVVDLILEQQLPAGAVALDWNWNVIKANRAMMAVVALFADPALLTPPLNAMRLVFGEGGLHRFVSNWSEVGPVMVERIRREASFEGRDEARLLLDELLGSSAVQSDWEPAEGDAPPALLIPMHLEKDGIRLSLFSTITTLGTPQDITLQELRIESFYPMDPESEAVLRALCPEDAS